MKHFGTEIKKHRKRLDLSMQALADRAGISKAMICKIENGDSQPTLEVAVKLARALNTHINHLIYQDDKEQVLCIRADDQPVWVDQSCHITRRTLSPTFAESSIEILRITIPANQVGLSIPHTVEEHSKARKYIHVLTGELEMTVDQKTYHLQQGDSLYFEASLGHHWRNPADITSEYLVVIELTD